MKHETQHLIFSNSIAHLDFKTDQIGSEISGDLAEMWICDLNPDCEKSDRADLLERAIAQLKTLPTDK